MNQSSDIELIDALRRSGEGECVEFKENMADPKNIGKYVSALANAAATAGEENGYLVWGVRDNDHAVVGTSFDPATRRVGDQPLKLWLAQQIKPDSALEFREIDHPGGRVVLLTIPAAKTSPVSFDRIAYIRINGTTPRLADHSERERRLWEMLQGTSWEEGVAMRSVDGSKVLALIDYPSYFDLTKQPMPENKDGVLDRLSQEKIIVAADGKWNITNLGAILFAKSLLDFGPPLSRKTLLLAVYDGEGRYDTVTHRREEQQGYAVGFNNLVSHLNGIIPARETIGLAFRTEAPLYPRVAIREIVANALIHQNMAITDAHPRVEMFRDRIEITNPGKLLIEPDRLIDAPPKSYNKEISGLMRRMQLSEELGTGIDKTVQAIEQAQSPPPEFQTEKDSTCVLLHAPRSFADMTKSERIRACYQHAALRGVGGKRMTNSTLRERFGLTDPRAVVWISQTIRATLDAELIRLADLAHPKSGYLPFWA